MKIPSFFGRLWAMSAVCLFCASGVRVDAAVEAPSLRVGVAARDITPDYAVRLSGFGGRRAESEGVTMRIWAKAMAFHDEASGPAILVTADNLCVPDEITKEVARRLAPKIGLKLERFTVTASHTHTAPMLKGVCPTLFGVPIPAEHQKNIDRYTGEFIDHLEAVALAAFADIRPARLSYGIGKAGFAANRRTKGGPVDHDLPLLLVQDGDGKVRGVYFSYACHCVTLSDNRISGDWAGFAQHRVQEAFPGAIAMASVGCGADSNPSSGVTGSNVQVCDDQGRELAEEIKRLIKAGLKPVDSGPQTQYARLDLQLAPARSRAEWEERAKRQDAVGHHARVNLERLDRGEPIPTSIDYPIQTWVFGENLAMVFLPGETVVDYSLRLKREYDRDRLWVNGYSNDGRCYIPSERVLKEGGYEGGDAMIYYDFPQYFAPGLEQKIIDTVSRQLPKGFRAAQGTEGTRPMSAVEALRSFKTKPGLKVELVAAEPLVQDPVAIDWGADGTLWVCEMHDYPSGLDMNWQPGGRVKSLRDSDGDGQYDSATVFLEGLPFPTGITAWGRGVFVCAAPDILYAEDTNGDGRADKVEKLFTGFFTDNFQARVNSLTLGLDNHIYAANGLLGGRIEALPNTFFHDTPKPPIDIRNHDFRFDPGRGAIELVSGLTQQGRARDDYDRWFGCDNSRLLLNYPVPMQYFRRNPAAPSPETVRQLASGPDGNRLYPASRLLERFNDPGHANRVTSACGLGIYRDDALGGEFYGNAFTCEPVHNLVHREVISGDDELSSARSPDEQESEFLASTDHWFRPVQARPGPDGALYIVDMYRFLIEHPRWIPAARLAQIDIRAGADKGRIYRVLREGQPPRPVRDLSKLQGAELAAAIESPSGAERDRVHVELVARQDRSAAAELERITTQAKMPQVRLHALAALEGIQSLEPPTVKRALSDESPHVRRHSVRLSERWLRERTAAASELLRSVLALTNDSSFAVREQLAFTLGESADPLAGRALADLAVGSPAHPALRFAILSSAWRHSGELLGRILQARGGQVDLEHWVTPLAATAATSPDGAVAARAARALLPANGEAPSVASLAALASLLDASETRGDGEVVKAQQGQPQWGGVYDFVRRTAPDETALLPLRLSAIALLGRDETDLDLLCRLAAEPLPDVRRAAQARLKRFRGAQAPSRLVAEWPRYSPSVRAEIIALLLEREDGMHALLKGVREGVLRPSEFSLNDRQRFAASTTPSIRELAAEVFPARNAGERQQVISRYSGALARPGNAVKGAEVFARACASCHALNGSGQNVGPDLVALRGKDPEYWLKNILDPNAVVEPRFITYEITLHDDRAVNGLIRGETAGNLTVVSASGIAETIARSDTRDIRASALSLMPEGLEEAVSPEEMADLIAYVRMGYSRKNFPGNNPSTVRAGADGVLMLTAAKAEFYGDSITFESPFNNAGMWHGQDDHLSWTAEIKQAAVYDVYLDYACAESSAGNKFVLTAAGHAVRGTVRGTGPDWSAYTQARVGQLELPAGLHQIIFRPESGLRGALIDLRAVAMTPSGQKPRWPRDLVPDPEVMRDPATVARFILDPGKPDAAREAAVQANPQFASALIVEMTRDLPPGSAGEYARIPWIWRVAIACGKRNDTLQLRRMIEASLPGDGEPLRDWQAVVIGGGIINGLSQRNIPPAERIRSILAGDDALIERWKQAIQLASVMADDPKIPAGTRYDALRMIAMESWSSRGAQLRRYLAPGTHPELQMGAVSGLADMPENDARIALVQATPQLTDANRDLALDALVAREGGIKLLRQALSDGTVRPDILGEERLKTIQSR